MTTYTGTTAMLMVALARLATAPARPLPARRASPGKLADIVIVTGDIVDFARL